MFVRIFMNIIFMDIPSKQYIKHFKQLSTTGLLDTAITNKYLKLFHFFLWNVNSKRF